jgi:hypothetical protein
METQTPHRINYTAPCSPRIIIPETTSFESHQQNTHQNTSNANSSQPNPPRRPGFFVYSENIVDEGVSACKKSILGKIITEKTIHISSIQNGLEKIWGSPQGLTIQEIDGGILQFFMNRSIDQERILMRNPWIFRNSWLIIKAWDRQTDPNLVDFNHAPIWVQLWGLPPHCKTKKMGESIGNFLGKVEAAEFYEYPGKKMIIKVKVSINVYQPIQTGILIGSHKDGTTWIDFRYENLPHVCFKCGILGHDEKLCQNEPQQIEGNAPLGPWIRSNQFGRRVMEEKDKKYYSNPSKSKTFGQFSPPIPASMLAQMQAMKIAEEGGVSQSSNVEQQTSPQHEQQETSDGKSVWHRTRRINNATGKEAMEISSTTALQNMAKRPRTNENGAETEGNQMAGPAGQASQQA